MPRRQGAREPVLKHRRAGVLLHPTSLPGPGENGDLGPNAFYFLDFMASAGLSVWQMLPLGPTHQDRSPYNALSVHAGNPSLISAESLRNQGWLTDSELDEVTAQGGVNRRLAVHRAHRGFESRAGEEEKRDWRRFADSQAWWLEDYALYQALKHDTGGLPWVEWPPALRDRDKHALDAARTRLAALIDEERFSQFVFQRQWHALKQRANNLGIEMFGDVPIFVAHDSADVWATPRCFRLDSKGAMTVVTGVPPDYFSAVGQRWGNPHYRWDVMRREGFAWWIQRLRTQLQLFDLVRIDHFRGFEASWEIPARAELAIEGKWIKTPGGALFRVLEDTFGELPVVAEDLGVITPQVEALRARFRFPGMRVLQFAFSGDPANPHLPYNHVVDAVVYTGTHDNDTSVGWFDNLDDSAKGVVTEYLGKPREPMPWPLVRQALGSVARLAILPMADVLGLGGEHRMNTPGTTEGNWTWRFSWDQIPEDRAAFLRRMIGVYGRKD